MGGLCGGESLMLGYWLLKPLFQIAFWSLLYKDPWLTTKTSKNVCFAGNCCCCVKHKLLDLWQNSTARDVYIAPHNTTFLETTFKRLNSTTESLPLVLKFTTRFKVENRMVKLGSSRIRWRSLSLIEILLIYLSRYPLSFNLWFKFILLMGPMVETFNYFPSSGKIKKFNISGRIFWHHILQPSSSDRYWDFWNFQD